MLSVFYVDRDSSAFPALFSVLCGIAAAVFSMHVLTSSTFILADEENYITFTKILIPASFCLLVLSILWFQLIVKQGKGKSSKDWYKQISSSFR